ncbi:hypothetical protein ebA3260 [Aromatoleum aromaticum EbN1]|nr:hypothetical protein ebA3260 [Aromatoleum aromaticum EbN1]
MRARRASPTRRTSFQSTPPVTEGRCHGHQCRRCRVTTVSIHAPRHRGAMPRG